FRSGPADQTRKSLGAAGSGHLAAQRLRQRELGAVAANANVTGQGQLEAGSEAVAVDSCDDGFGAALGSGQVDPQVRELVWLVVEETAHVAARAEIPASAGDDDHSNLGVGRELSKDVLDLLP